MNSRFIGTIVLSVFTLIVVGPSPLLAETPHAYILASFENRPYDLGDTVNITIETFVEGERTWDADLEIVVGDADREIPSERVPGEVGLYRCSPTLLKEDIDKWGNVWLRVRMDGGRGISESYLLMTSDTKGFQTRIHLPNADDEAPLPGQEVEVEIRTTFAGESVDVDLESLHLSVVPVIWAEETRPEQEILVERVSTGRYAGVFTIPPDAIGSTEFRMSAHATYMKDGATRSEYDMERLFLHLLSAYTTVSEVTASQVHLDVGLVDREGSPASGAVVNLSIMAPSYNRPSHVWSEVRIADEHGRAMFILNISDLETNWSSHYILCRAQYNGIEQLFDGGIATEAWDGDGYWRVFQDDVTLLTDLPLPPGEEVTLEYQTSLGNDDTGVDRIAVYIYDDERVYSGGLVQFDDDGRFKVELETPEVSGHRVLTVEVERRWRVSGSWSTDWSYLLVSDGRPASYWERMVDGNLTMTVEPGEEPGLFDLSIEGSGDAKVSILWGLDHPFSLGDHPWYQSYAPYGAFYPGRWLDTNTRQYAGQYFWRTNIATCSWEDGAHSSQVMIPWYLPDDAEVYFLGVIEPEDAQEPRAVLIKGTMGELWEWAVREPPTAPGQIIIEKPVVTKRSVTLTWKAPDGDGGSPVTGYVIYRGLTKDAMEVLAEVGPTTTDWTDEDVKQGETYWYTIAPENDVGEGEPAVALNVTIPEKKLEESPGMGAAYALLSMLISMAAFMMRRKGTDTQ